MKKILIIFLATVVSTFLNHQVFGQFSGGGSAATGDKITKPITQTAHGFVVGDWVYYTGGIYAKTDADLSIHSVGVVATVTDANTFVVTNAGYVTGLSGLVAGSKYYLSQTAGAITATAPTLNIKAVFLADGTSSGWIQQFEVGATSSEKLSYFNIATKANFLCQSVSTSLGSGYFVMDFDNSVYVTNNKQNIGSLTGNYVEISTAGTYMIIGTAGNVSGTSDVDFSIRVNQVNVAGNDETTGSLLFPTIIVIRDLVVGDKIEWTSQSNTFGKGATFTVQQLPTSVAPVIAGYSAVPLTYGRVNASADLPNTGYSSTGVGTPIPFNATVYSSGTTFSGTSGIIPSVAGRYRADWLAMAGSGDFAFDGQYNIVQNGVVVGSVFIDQMQAAGVNQTTPFIDVDLVAGQVVTFNYQPTSNDAIVFERGSYFQLTQKPEAVAPVVNAQANSLNAVATITQSTNLTVGSHIMFQSASVNVDGSNILLDVNTPYTNTANAASMGRITLQPGFTYLLMGNPGYVGGAGNALTSFEWFNADTNTKLPNGSISLFQQRNGANDGGSSSAVVKFAPSVATRVELRITSNNATISTMGNSTLGYPSIYIEAISGGVPANFPTVNGGVVFGNGTTQVQDVPNLFFDDANNRLGIGNAIPLSKIHVKGDGFSSPNNAGVRFENNGTLGRAFMVSSRSDINIPRMSFSDETVGAERMTIGSDGFIGVGQISPQAKIHIRGDGNSSANNVAIRFESDGGSGRAWNVGTRGDGGTQRFYISDETGSAERFGIDASGKTWVGQGAAPALIPGYGGAGLNVISIGGSDGLNIRGPGSNNALNIYQPNGAIAGVTYASFISDRGGTATQQGRIEASAIGGTINYNTSSDQRLKIDTGKKAKGLEDLLKLKVRNYDWKSGGNADGFFAQELYKIVPSAVSVGTDEVDANGNLKNPWGVDYGKLTPILVKAVQDLSEKVAELELKLSKK